MLIGCYNYKEQREKSAFERINDAFHFGYGECSGVCLDIAWRDAQGQYLDLSSGFGINHPGRE